MREPDYSFAHVAIAFAILAVALTLRMAVAELEALNDTLHETIKIGQRLAEKGMTR